jgi:hypothetical protein
MMVDDSHSAEASTSAHAGPHDDEIHMPPNSYWPLVASFGTAGTLFGLISITSNPVIFILGLIVLLVGVGGWVRDARTEYNELH